MGLWKRIEKRMAAVGIKTQPELSAAVRKQGGSLSQPQISGIKNGTVDRPRSLPELANALKTTAEWLIQGTDRRVDANGTILHVSDMGTIVTSLPPLVLYRSIDGTGRVGELLVYREKIGDVPRPRAAEFSADAFAVRVRFDDMSPAFEVDDVLCVDPSAALVPNKNYLFVSNFDRDPFTGVPRRLVRATAEYWEVASFHPERKTDRLRRADYRPLRIVAVYSF